MTDNVTKFCESIHEKLESLDGRMDALKLNIGTTWHFLQEKLGEVRRKGEDSKPSLAEARTELERWFTENNAEPKGIIQQWIANHETEKLATRARRAEECAWAALRLAEASIDDAERMILEAISAKLDAEAVAHA